MGTHLYKSAISALVLGASLSLGTAGQASEPYVGPAPSTFNWTGFYAGIHLGYATGSYDQGSPALPVGPNVDVDGFVAGGTLGYNYQINNIVLGIEADISTGPDGITAQGTQTPGWRCNTGACNASIDWFGTIRARLGLAMDNWLLFVSGGYAYGEVDGGIYNSAQQGGGSADGWAAGAGVEYAMTQNLIAKFEYLHVDLGDIPFGTGLGSTDPYQGSGDFEVFRGGINIKF